MSPGGSMVVMAAGAPWAIWRVLDGEALLRYMYPSERLTWQVSGLRGPGNGPTGMVWQESCIA
jgi:hypothetical protein